MFLNSSLIIDWGNVFGIFLGAVLGFLSSVSVGIITKKIGAFNLLKKLKQELNSNYEVIMSNIETTQRFYILSPIWDFIIKSDLILTFGARKYARIIKLYVELETFRKSESDDSTPTDKLIDNRRRFIKAIEENKL